MNMTDVQIVTDHRGSTDRTGSCKDATQIAYAGSDVLRATVHLDYYEFQNRATVEVWRDGWQEIIRLGGSDVQEPDATLPELYRLAALVLQPRFSGAPESPKGTLTEADIVRLVTAYQKAVETNDAEAAVAGALGHDDVGDASIVDEVIEHGAHHDLLSAGDLDADSYRRLTARVSTYRTILRKKFEREAAAR